MTSTSILKSTIVSSFVSADAVLHPPTTLPSSTCPWPQGRTLARARARGPVAGPWGPARGSARG
jgi:hypothetical protein